MRILRVITKEVGKALLSPAECTFLEIYVLNQYVVKLAPLGDVCYEHDNIRYDTPIVLIDAVKNNRFDVLNMLPGLPRKLLTFLLGDETEWHNEYCYRVRHWAAEFGRLGILIWTIRNDCNINSYLLCNWAVRGGNLDIVRWLHKKGAQLTDDTMLEAASRGHIETMKWLHKRHVPISARSCVLAAINGHLPALKWLKEQGGYVDTATICAAANGGHLNHFLRKWV